MLPLLVDLALWGAVVSHGLERVMILPLGGFTGHLSQLRPPCPAALWLPAFLLQ